MKGDRCVCLKEIIDMKATRFSYAIATHYLFFVIATLASYFLFFIATLISVQIKQPIFKDFIIDFKAVELLRRTEYSTE